MDTIKVSINLLSDYVFCNLNQCCFHFIRELPGTVSIHFLKKMKEGVGDFLCHISFFIINKHRRDILIESILISRNRSISHNNIIVILDVKNIRTVYAIIDAIGVSFKCFLLSAVR